MRMKWALGSSCPDKSRIWTNVGVEPIYEKRGLCAPLWASFLAPLGLNAETLLTELAGDGGPNTSHVRHLDADERARTV
jgi:hypothetical protein